MDEIMIEMDFYRCPYCNTTYNRPFREVKIRPIRRCNKCNKVVTMLINR